MRIVFDCELGGPKQWGPRSIDQGIGGSEESVIYLSKELTSLGHEVYVFSRGDKGSVLLSDGIWLNSEKHDPRIAVPECDIFIAWRNWHLFDRAPRTAKKYLACHDIPVEPHWNSEALNHFDKIILLNDHHRNLYNVSPDRAFVVGNGVDLAQFNQQVDRVSGRCLYFSHPHRGLHKLREYWPQIREAVPHATLASFWWEKDYFLPSNEALGILPMRSLGHKELAKEILSAEFLSYPSVFSPEIAPITCIKSQIGGAIPVTVNCGGMAETILNGISTSHADYAKTLIGALRGEISIDRDHMMRVAREHFDWSRIARAWSDEFAKALL